MSFHHRMTPRQQAALAILEAIVAIPTPETLSETATRQYEAHSRKFTERLATRLRKALGMYEKERDIHKGDRVIHRQCGRGVISAITQTSAGRVVDILFDGTDTPRRFIAGLCIGSSLIRVRRATSKKEKPNAD